MKTKRRRVLFALQDYDAEMHKGVAKYAREHNWHLQVVSPSYGPVYEFWTGDGIISCAYYNPNFPLTRFVLDYDGPKVEFGHLFYDMPDTNFSCVYEDNEKIGQMAADYFLNKRFKNFLYLASHHFWHNDERGRHFVKALADAGYTARELYLQNEISDMKEMFGYLAEYVTKSPKPLAVFCSQDSLSQWIIQACRNANIRVPEEVAVLGTGNHKMVCDWGDTPSSSIDTNLRFWGYSAAKLLDQMIDDPDYVKSIELVPPRKVVERLSTDTTAVNDEAVAQAMRFIQDNINRPISVEDVVESTGKPKSTLTRRFRKVLGHSIIKEINRQKIEMARKLLVERTKNTVEIAGELGFSTPFYFYRIFKQETGMTPKEYLNKIFPN